MLEVIDKNVTEIAGQKLVPMKETEVRTEQLHRLDNSFSADSINHRYRRYSSCSHKIVIYMAKSLEGS